MNVPTTFPFFNGTRKQAPNRDGTPVVLFSPRTQLPPFLIQRPHVANDWVEDIFLVDCDGNEIDLQRYFENSSNLCIGGYTNGIGALQAMDTLRQDNESLTNGSTYNIDSAVKTTTGAGDAGFDSAVDFAVTDEERLYLEVDLTLNSGVAPKVVIVDAGDESVQRSNEVLLVAGVNHIIFTITATDATASLLFFNDTADQTDYEATITLTRTSRPEVHEYTDVDYIQYNGGSLVWTGNLIDEIINARAPNNFDTFTTGIGVSISSAIEIAGTARAEAFPRQGIAIEGNVYRVHVAGVVINSGATPEININNSVEGAQSLNAGDNVYTFTIDSTPAGTANLFITTAAATDFETGQISVYKLSGNIQGEFPTGKGLLPRGTFYLKLTDGTNEWFSEWFNISDVYENLTSALTESGYETFISSGTKIISAINSAGSGQAFASGTDNINNDEVITVIFFLALNSGALPTVALIDLAITKVISNVENSIEGINEIELTATEFSDFQIRFFNNTNTNYSTSEIWVKRQYSPRFVKLQFTNDKDLHGKRSDDQTILYQEGFTQECWLQTILNTPGSNRVDVGQEKDGVFVAEKIITQYKYRIIDYLNRSLFEGLIRLPQHDDITIIDEVGNQYTPDVGNVQVSAEWGTFDTGDITIEWNDGSFVWVENADDIT